MLTTWHGVLDVLCGSGNGVDFGHHIIPALIRSVPTYAYDFRDNSQNAPDYWRDIGTIDAYYAASMELLQAETAVPIRQSRPGINAMAQVGRSVLSPGVQVAEHATVYDSILMPGVRVGTGARLRRVIVGEGVHVPAGVSAGFDVKQDRIHQTVSENGVVVIAKNPGKQTREYPRACQGHYT